MKITSNKLGIREVILYICFVYSKNVIMIDLKNVLLTIAPFRFSRINLSNLVHAFLDTRLSPSTNIGGGFFYRLYCSCISLNWTKSLKKNTAAINNTTTHHHSGSVHPTTRTSVMCRQKVVSENNMVRLLSY